MRRSANRRGPILPGWVAIIAPGVLVAATGVGAGDLITASLAGSELGIAVLWAAAAGAALKWTLNEGIARWQLATGTTLLEGWVTRLRWLQWPFLLYFLVWTFAVGGALINACGIAGAALLPLADPQSSKVVWGIVHSLAGWAIVCRGGFRAFQALMAACTAVMFACVLPAAALIGADWPSVLRGILVPRVPAGGTGWTLGVLGGVGGTVTLLAYGYWIREAGRSGQGGVRLCRIDLAVGYLLTALFGMAMIVIGSQIEARGTGARVALDLAEQLQAALGPWAGLVFLVGFWGAVFSSLLGVWQSAPYLFADFLELRRRKASGIALAANSRTGSLRTTTAYRAYLAAIAVVPLILLWQPVKSIQLAYAVLGALFMPLLAFTLLVMNNHRQWVAPPFRNGWLINLGLIVTLAIFVALAALEILGKLPLATS